MGRWIDISMALTDGLRSNHSRPGEEVRLTYDVRPEDDPDQRKTVRRVNTRLHVGTHVDGPEHLVRGGKRLDEFPIDSFVGRAWVVDMYHKVPRGTITTDDLDAAVGEKVEAGDNLIVRTGWNSHYTAPDFYTDTPYFGPRAAEWCVDRKVKMVAVDFLCDPMVKELQVGGVDAFKRAAFEAGMLVITNVDNLDQIKRDHVTLYAFPIKIVPSEASLARAVVWEE